MNLSSLASPSTTSYEFIHPLTDKPTGVFVEGYTPDSKEYRQLEAKHVSGNKKQFVKLKKKSDPEIEIDADAADRRDQLMIAVITNIHGAPDFEYSEENKKALLTNPAYSWMLEQWREHLDDRANFFMKPEPTA